MTKVFKANMYFLIILLIEIFGPLLLRPFYLVLGLSDTRIILFLNHVILFLLPAVIYIIATKSSFKETLKLNKLHWQDTLLIILLAFVVQPIMTFFSLIATFFFNNEIGSFISEITSTPYVFLLALVALLPAITEEVTIRGIVLSGYENKNKYVSAIVTGLFFGILHLDPQQFLYAAVLGFILALVVRVTNSIFSSMIMHFIINGTSVTMAKLVDYITKGLPVTNQSAELTLKNISSSEKLVLFIMYGAIAVTFSIFVFLIIYWLEKLNSKRRAQNYNYRAQEVSETVERKDRVINIPFILSIGIYIFFMIRTVAL
ncbi:MAG: type II CAAX endopeptidase family protein [Clostridium sp.]|nr:type II CAAX endopeptidase family protein [Clostridium sp.]MBS5886813.1 CPBP family intramembrane metalloprotease [Clostridium sp.]MDU7150357.1 type II CAAX endopeptidase family protein [Clostridium sp.]MDU7243542.1 type II CAAX endopeptidase family protein [Clostridium sp.]